MIKGLEKHSYDERWKSVGLIFHRKVVRGNMKPQYKIMNNVEKVYKKLLAVP